MAGQRSAVNRQINEAFQRSGTAHLLAVSGSHVALIATVGGVLGWMLLRRPKRAALLAFAAVVFFSLLVDPNVPALRSAIMAILAVSGMLLNRPFNVGNWLAASAAVLLLVNPADLFAPPLQMTYAAVIALILLTPAICTFLFGPRDLAGWLRLRIRLAESPTRWSKSALTLKNALSYSVAAWLANVPLIAWHFGQFNLYGALATVLLVPLATPALVLGFCKMLLGLLVPSLGELLARPLERMADWMARFAAWLGSWPGASLSVPPPPLWLVVLLYVLLACWALSARRRWYEAWPVHARGRRLNPIAPDVSFPIGHGGLIPVGGPAVMAIYHPVRPRYIILVAAGLMGLYALAVRPANPDHVRVHVLSVGNGECVLVRCPGGRNLLYDCGSITISSVGEKVVVPALRALGISRIDAVLLSHGDLDHYDGLIDLARAMPIGRVWLSNAFRRQAQEGSPKRLLQDLKALGVPLVEAVAGVTIPDLGPVAAEVLWPPADLKVAAADSNDTSVVLRITDGQQRILLTGDIARYAQQRLASDDPDAIRADVPAAAPPWQQPDAGPDFRASRPTTSRHCVNS